MPVLHGTIIGDGVLRHEGSVEDVNSTDRFVLVMFVLIATLVLRDSIGLQHGICFLTKTGMKYCFAGFEGTVFNIIRF